MKQAAHLPQGTIHYHEEGSGEPLLFIHGIVMNSALWRKTTPPLARDFRCIMPDWPLGAHSIAMDPEADFSLPGLAQMVLDFMDAIELQTATLIGNDSGGAIAQMVAVTAPERVDRLFLNSCELYERFLPPIFKPLEWLSILPGSIWVSAQLMRLRWAQNLPIGHGGSMKKGLPERAVMDAYLRPGRESAGVRRDLRKFLRAVDKRYTLEAAEQLKRCQAGALGLGRRRQALPTLLSQTLRCRSPQRPVAGHPGLLHFRSRGPARGLGHRDRRLCPRARPGAWLNCQARIDPGPACRPRRVQGLRRANLKQRSAIDDAAGVSSISAVLTHGCARPGL